MLPIKVGDEEFVLTDEEVKVLETDMISIFEWTKNALQNKARQTTHFILLDKTDRQPNKMSLTEKQELIRGLNLETAKARNIRIEAEINE